MRSKLIILKTHPNNNKNSGMLLLHAIILRQHSAGNIVPNIK